MKIRKSKSFANGDVYCIELSDGMLIETTDTYLPYYTKNAINRHQNILTDNNLGSRSERWMIGVSVMSGCPVGCKFCATGNMGKYRNLSVDEIVSQVEFVIQRNDCSPNDSQEFKINYTRMGEPFLNIENVRKAVELISAKYPNTHHYISTIGIRNADYSWIKDNITLQISLHSLNDISRNYLIPFKNKVSINELGKIQTQSNLKTTINLTLVNESDFDIDELTKHFNKDNFFIKISPINPNEVSMKNELGNGIINSINLI